ncbi:hypothetical protein, conserved [Babesia ovata]|uniref:C3H1-type domain-containing protein n=1 Tax=Babesia ovata TaxID=189622 RepID=A0A2H6KJ89_9APIC|nr:uncharacterized protein BOVATA_045320 [Babesia ovata]GBE63039.1 hypothetical protein, conserved [Babesia ovata]
MLSCSPNPQDPLSYCSQLDEQIKSKNEELQKAKNTNNTSEISSLESQINDLKSNKDDCTKSHYMDGERLSSLEEEVQHGIDVIVKLTQFSGSEKSVLELIKKEIERLEKHKKDCETCKKSPQSPASSDCAQHKLLEELKKKRETLNQNNDNSPKELLNNLCSGLEKFLGYQETSKGYDGTGIVYSDLDRLCDGVMSFLHGVLDNIKPKLGLHKTHLTSALSELKSTNDNGITKYKAAIAAVASSVHTYNEKVAASNKSVSTPMNVLIKYVREDGKLLGTVNKFQISENADHHVVDEAEKIINDTLEECQKNAAKFNSTLDTEAQIEIRNIISELNPTLSLNVKSALKAVKHETKRLSELSEKEKTDLQAMTAKITDVLAGVQEKMICKIDEKIKALAAELKKKVDDIWHQLKGIDSLLIKYVKDLEKWINDVKKFITEQPQNNVQKVLDEVNWDVSSKKSGPWKNAEDEIQKLGSGLGTKVSQLTAWNKAGAAAIKAAKKQCEEIGKMVGTTDNGDGKAKIFTKAQEMKENAEKLRVAAESVKSEVASLVGSALREVATMNDQLKTDLGNMKKELKKELQRYVKGEMAEKLQKWIEGETNKIAKNGSGGGDGHLDEIVKQAGSYVGTFEAKFKAWIEEWLPIIVTQDPIKRFIESYAFGVKHVDNKIRVVLSDSATQDNIEAKVKKFVADEVNTHIKDIIAPRTNASDGNVDAKLQSIQQYLVTYSARVLAARKSEEEIIQAIERKLTSDPDLGMRDPSKSQYRQYLGYAVVTTLFVLAAIARHVGAHIKNVAGECKLGKVDPAREAVKSLGKNLKNALTTVLSSSSVGGNLADEIMTPINENILNEQIGTDDGQGRGSSGGDKVKPDKLKNYGNHVKQEDSIQEALKKGDLKGVPDAGSLPNAINNISTQGLKSLTDEGEPKKAIDGGESYFQQPFSQITAQLTAIAGLVDSENKVSNKDVKDGVKDYLTDLEEMLKEGKPYTLKSTVKGEHPTVQGLLKIKTEIQGLKTSSVTNLTSNVDKLCSAIRQAAQDVKGNLDILKEDNIEKKLEKIKTDISKLQNETLKKAIDDTGRLLTLELGLFSSRCIASLEGDVRQQVEEAKKQLTTQAKKLYVTSVRDMLLAFASKVSEELHELPKQITEDAEKGVRGFMKKMEERFIKTGKRIANVSPTQSPAALPNPVPEGKSKRPKSPLSQAAMTLNTAFRLFFDDLQNQPDFKSDYDNVAPCRDALTALLNGIVGSLRFNHDFSVNLELLSKSLSGLNPESHGECECPLLINALRAGFPALVTELDKAYMNKYDGASKDFKWEEGDKLTDEATKCAKLFLTTLPVLNNNLNKLTRKCHVDSRRNWRESQINLRVDNPLGKFLAGQGYAVSSDYESQDGELQNNDAMRGQKIYELLVGSADKHVYTTLDDKADEGALNKFCNCLLDFYKASHLKHINAPKYPTTISHMLEWLCGLTHHPVYQSLSLSGFADLFEKPKEQDTDNAPLVVSFNDDPDSLDAYPRKITATGLSQTLVEVCHLAEDTLIAIVGHGHADGVYACDYNTNRHGLSYPTNMNTLICTLFDILQRLHCQLYFLYNQCYYGDMYNGWRECYYGNGVGGSSWKCNTMQCANQMCAQQCNQTHNQICNQICEQHPKCGVKSPLQSFLEDGLQGFLPHAVSSRGSSLSCSSCSKLSPGVPCRTPMGFVDISTLASHTSTGERIIRALLRFCGINSSPLSNLCALLNCVLPRPPQSLGAMFAFYYNFIAHWGQPGNAVLTNAVSGANFKRNDATLDIAPLFKSSDHTSEEEMTHRTGDLYTLVNCKSDSSSPTLPCGPYLRPHSRDICSTFAEKNADKYLSWIVYLTQTFYDLLKTLYKECCEMCDKRGTTCYQKCCDKKCEVIYPDESKKHTGEYEKEVAKYWTARHNSECKSIFKCSHTIKIFSKYGFYFGSPSKMSGSEHVNSKRTCRDFCKALATVLNDVEADEAPLAKLIYRTIPEFLWKIREPFIWTLVALWSLSLLYLLHIAVVRLDVLRIRSHLRSPSSHRIAAQSLLAAAHVKALANVKHGNGGDGKGLEELAKALKKLIGNAVKSATESLEKRRKELECADKGSSNLYDKHCNDLKEKIKKAKGDEKSKLQSQYNGHYSEVHGSESKRQSGEKDLAERRISLGQLAGQLAGFIGGGKEVQDAILHGLHSNVTQLEKLLNASCGGEGCCRTDKITLNTYNESLKKHLKDEQKASEKLVDILSECKLNGLDGPLKQLNVEITQKIEELEKEIESLKKLDKDAEKAGQKPKNASEVDKLNKDLQSHNASKKSLDTLKELCGYADKIQKNDVDQNSSTDILKNLTEGLEKFLGYNKDSKGYSGEGIVYSDLDRLCDGVMSFLHGVLESVMEDDSVTKYSDINDINSVIKNLNDNVGKGRQAFGNAVTQVSEWLENHAVQVRERTGAVKTKLGELITKLSSDSGKYYKEVNEKNGLSAQLTEWTRTLGEIARDITDVANTNVNFLDTSLSSRIMHEIKPIQKSVELLHVSAMNSVLTKQANNVDWALVDQQTRIVNAINSQSGMVHDMLSDHVNKIGETLGALNTKREKQFEMLRESLQAAKRKVESELSGAGSTRNQIYNKFVQIKGLLVKVDKDKSRSTQSQLREQVDKIKSQLLEVGSELEAQVSSLDKWMENTKEYIDEAKKNHVDKLVKKEVGMENIAQINYFADALKNEATDIRNAFTAAEGYLNKLVTDTLEGVKTMDGTLKGDLRKVKDEIERVIRGYVKHTLLKEVTERINEIKAGMTTVNQKGDTASGGISDLRKEVDELKSALTKQVEEAHNQVTLLERAFQAAAQEAHDTLNPAVERVKALKNLSPQVKLEITTTAQELVNSLKQKIADIKNKFSGIGSVNTSIKSQLSTWAESNGEAGQAFEASLTKAAQEHAQKVDEKYVQDITSALSNVGKALQKLKPLSVDKKALEAAINVFETATEKVKTLGNAESEVRKAIEKVVKKIKQLEAVYPKVTGLETHLIRATNVRGTASQSHATGPSGAIDTFDVNGQILKVLNEQIGKTVHSVSPPTVTLEPGKFPKYELQVDQSTVTGPPDKLSGTLPEKIKEIRDEGLNFLRNTIKDKADENTGRLYTSSKEVSENLKYLATAYSLTGRYIDRYMHILTHEKIDEQLTAIRASLYSLRTIELSDAPGKIQDAITTAMFTVNELEAVPGEVDKARGAVDGVLETLRKDISAILTSIELNVTAADDTISSGITTTKNALAEAYHKINDAVTTLKTTLLAAVQSAFTQVTCEIQKLFANQHQADLNALQKLITEQKAAILKIIYADLNSGIKGLLMRMNKDDGKILEKIKERTDLKNSDDLMILTKKLQGYLGMILNYAQYKAKNPEKLKEDTELSSKIKALHASLDAIFDKLLHHQHFHHAVSQARQAFEAALQAFPADTFPDAPKGVLQPLKQGLVKFAQELEKQYVSRYSGKVIVWMTSADPETKQQEPTEDAKKCAKVFMTCVQMLLDNLSELRSNCGSKDIWQNKTISLTETGTRGNIITNPLGAFFQRCGYRVSSAPNKHTGELRNTTACRGGNINSKLNEQINNKDYLIKDEDLKKEKRSNKDEETDDQTSPKQHGILKQLFDHLHDYYTVCHYSTLQSKTYPSSVFDMLKWLCGLTHNPVYADLSVNGFDKLLEQYQEKDEETDDADEASASVDGADGNIPVIFEKPKSLQAYPHEITSPKLRGTLQEVCHYSYDVLTGVLGFGHDDGVYACDYNINQGGLSYPTNMDTLLCMICDVINRLYRQLHFLFQQCRYDSTLSGWSDCWYGNGVGGSAWKCNSMQCPGQGGDQSATQKHNQKCNQKCEQRVMCGVKSPLQSFLEDGLQGFLPHSLKSERGKLECSLKSHGGVPCITPMGFAGIAGLASHRRTGQFLMEVLADFCGNQKSPLTKICSLFNCVLPSPPKSLSDMFGFYYSLLCGWEDSSKRYENRKQHRETAFNNAVSGADFDNPSTTLDITDMFKSSNHILPKPADQTTTHLTGDLYALVNCADAKSHTPSHPCGPYLKPLCSDICTMFSAKHANKYVSWIVFLTESFYDLLKRLLEDCEKTCGAEARRCKIGKCSEGCKTKKLPYGKDSKHDKSCRSIVDCNYIRPTFYKYGFIHESVSSLSGVAGVEGKRTCADFCAILKIVTGEKKTLHTIVFEKITGFLWAIREKFFWTLLALWSLSLLYLLHIAVVRLDVLRIRSHLRSPSSHRIAAQSLLAAARVKALANVKYFSP